MREIKFRAWEKSLKELIPVFQINFENKIINTDSAWRNFDEVELMQYTGLKDKNGKEIYEGDIVKFATSKDSYRGLVEFGEGMYTVKVGLNFYLNEIVGQGCEVIGNIYEAPELVANSDRSKDG